MEPASSGSEELSIRLSDAGEEQWRRYGRAKCLLDLADFLVLISVLAVLSFSGAARFLLAASHPAGSPSWLGHLVFLVLIGFAVRLALFPIQLASEYWLDRRYGIRRESLRSWFWEWLCRSAVFGLATVAVLFPVAETLRWWLYLILPWTAAFLFFRPLF